MSWWVESWTSSQSSSLCSGLGQVTVLCSWASHFTLAVPLSKHDWGINDFVTKECMHVFKGVSSRLTHLEKFSLNFSRSSFTIRVNLLHPEPSLFLYGSLLSPWCFSILVTYYFQLSFYLKVILYTDAQNDSKHRTSFVLSVHPGTAGSR